MVPPPPPPPAPAIPSSRADALTPTSATDPAALKAAAKGEADLNGVTPADLNKLRTLVDIDALYLKLAKTKFKEQDAGNYEHAALRPSFPDLKWAALEPFEVTDVALRADPEYTDLFKAVERVEHLTPKYGTVLHGVDLANLTDAQKDQLARYTAFRGLVVFRKQTNFDIDSQLALGRHWGSLHRHATTALPAGHADKPELLDVHIVWGDENRVPHAAFSQTHLWHSDVTYELQPPSYTTLKLLQGPPVGGDTLWTSGYALYDSLSPSLQRYLEEHTALHSAKEQAEDSRRSGKAVRREPVVTEHPLVRVHPVTGYKSVFVNPGFTRSIVGVPAHESKAILNLLFELIATNVETTARWKWEQDDVALWDNRVSVHSASWGFYPHRRHAARVAATGEKPFYRADGKSQQKELEAALGLQLFDQDGAARASYND